MNTYLYKKANKINEQALALLCSIYFYEIKIQKVGNPVNPQLSNMMYEVGVTSILRYFYNIVEIVDKEFNGWKNKNWINKNGKYYGLKLWSQSLGHPANLQLKKDFDDWRSQNAQINLLDLMVLFLFDIESTLNLDIKLQSTHQHSLAELASRYPKFKDVVNSDFFAVTINQQKLKKHFK